MIAYGKGGKKMRIPNLKKTKDAFAHHTKEINHLSPDRKPQQP
jgi:hypothetical protein